MKPRIGIVGTGTTVGIAHFHTLGVLADGRAEITAVYNLNRDSAARFLTEHGLDEARVCDSYAQLLDRVDAVLICTPNYTHIDYALEAIRADKAVFVEKPLALSSQDSFRAVQALQGKNLFAVVGFVMRYAFVMQELRKLVRNEIGRVYTFQATYGKGRLADPRIPVEWRMQQKYSGSGALGDFGSHLIDLTTFTAGLRFETVSAMASTVIPNRPPNEQGVAQVDNDDQAAVIARTADHALATFTVSRVGMDSLRLLVAGEGGLARVNMDAPETIHYLPAQNGVYAQEVRQIAVPPQITFDGWFVAQMQAFIDGLTGNPTEMADIYQGHYVESVLEAARKASETPAINVELE